LPQASPHTAVTGLASHTQRQRRKKEKTRRKRDHFEKRDLSHKEVDMTTRAGERCAKTVHSRSCLFSLGLVGGVLGRLDGLGDALLDGSESLVDLLGEAVIERAPDEEEEGKEVGDAEDIELLEDEGKDEGARDEADGEENVTDKDDLADSLNEGLDDATHELEEALEVAVVLGDLDVLEEGISRLALEVSDDALDIEDKSGEDREEGEEEEDGQEVVLVTEDKSGNNVDADKGDRGVDEVDPVEDVVDLGVSLDLGEGSLENLPGVLKVKVALAATAALGSLLLRGLLLLGGLFRGGLLDGRLLDRGSILDFVRHVV